MDTDSLDSLEEKRSLINKPEETNSLFPKVKHYPMTFILVFLVFISFIIDSVLFPFFPKVGTNKGLLLSETGIVFSAFDLTRFLTAPIAGRMFDICHPKKLCTIGAIIAGSACISFGLTILANSKELFFASCLLIRCIAGVGSALMNVAGTSLLLKASGFETTTVVALVETANKVGYTFGPAVGAFLYELTGYIPMFSILGGCLMILIPIYYFIVPKVEEKCSETHGGFLSFLAIPGIFLMFLGWAVTKFSATTRTTGMANFYYLTFGTNTTMIGVLFTIWSAAAALGNAVITKILVKKYAAYMLLALWILFIPLVLLGLPSPPMSYLFGGKGYYIPSITVLSILAFFVGFFHILCFSVAQQVARMNGYPEHSLYTYGLLTGLMNSGLCLGSTIGPIITGIITDYSRYEWTQTMNSAIYTIMGKMIKLLTLKIVNTV
ncbi:MFS-type transporter SLC18B1-like isoform X2 [Watersipora subatra]|uniref:MFS-type transporter SLC18B1-like isoform X2 n=1 Tax=Watersipora subatra TaxID=2589382 RepID=UPI00355C245B